MHFYNKYYSHDYITQTFLMKFWMYRCEPQRKSRLISIEILELMLIELQAICNLRENVLSRHQCVGLYQVSSIFIKRQI